MNKKKIYFYLNTAFSIFILLSFLSVIYFVHQSKDFNLDGAQLKIVFKSDPPSFFREELKNRGLYQGFDKTLFSLKFSEIEKKILLHPWVKSIEMTKEVPSSLTIQIQFKEPLAVLRTKAGNLFYLDENAQVISSFSLQRQTDLPFLYGVSFDQKKELKDAMAIIRTWKSEGVNNLAKIAQLDWTEEYGWKSTVLLPSSTVPLRTTLVWLEGNLSRSKQEMQKLLEVFQYISVKKVEVNQILFVSDKKIVVRFI